MNELIADVPKVDLAGVLAAEATAEPGIDRGEASAERGPGEGSGDVKS